MREFVLAYIFTTKHTRKRTSPSSSPPTATTAATNPGVGGGVGSLVGFGVGGGVGLGVGGAHTSKNAQSANPRPRKVAARASQQSERVAYVSAEPASVLRQSWASVFQCHTRWSQVVGVGGVGGVTGVGCVGLGVGGLVGLGVAASVGLGVGGGVGSGATDKALMNLPRCFFLGCFTTESLSRPHSTSAAVSWWLGSSLLYTKTSRFRRTTFLVRRFWAERFSRRGS